MTSKLCQLSTSLQSFWIALLLFVSMPLLLSAEDITYTVKFEGVDNKDVISTLETVSELFILQSSPPATVTALHRRAEADVSNLVRGLHTFGYYNAKVELDINTDQSPAVITIHIDLGPIYPLASYEIKPDEHAENECQDDDEDDRDDTPFPFDTISLDSIGIHIGDPALPKTILNSEEKIIELMAKRGYPLAAIKNRDIIADQSCNTIAVTIYVDSGPKACFGPTNITGLNKVNECFIRKKLGWCEGGQYDPILIEKCLNDIESSGLFSSVIINTPDEVSEESLLPINIDLIETKHRTIGGGVSYNTQIGPGFIATWEHRNIRGLGEKLGFHADVAQKRQTGTILFSQPDFMSPNQDLVWVTELESEKTRGFSDTAFSFSGIIDRELNCNSKFSYGGTIKQLHTEHSNNNRQFVLLKAPLLYRWSSANSLLDPTKGQTLLIRVVPTTQIVKPHANYVINTITGMIYQPITSDNSLVLAAKASLGIIWGASDISIPPPERFYIGSESTLRGYNYMTVSPLVDNKPIGGRSFMVYSAEARYRISEEFGAVGFYEVGNAYENVLPQFVHVQRQSVGCGLRYHTPVGPLRFDIAFPLNRRHHVDRHFQFYFSIGQSF